MNRLEEELRRALRPVEPPAGFAERLLARAARDARAQHSPGGRRRLRLPGSHGLRWAAVGALCAAMAAGGWLYERERARRGEEAKNQLMLALRITGSNLRGAQQDVREINSAGGENR
jgi:hypothetical protein